jgi:hypothetical protein
MAANTKTESGTADSHGRLEFASCAHHILDYIGQPGPREKVTYWANEIRVRGLRRGVPLAHRGIVLARRRSVNRVEHAVDAVVGLGHVVEKRQPIALSELKRIVRLWVDVHADHFEPCLVVAHRCSTSTTEQVEQPRTRFNWLP